MEWLKDVLIAVGGGATAVIAVLSVFKSMFLQVFDKALDSALDKGLEKYRNKLSRTTTAYELLLDKELTYYSTLDPHLATLVPLIQDLPYYAKGRDNMDRVWQCNQFKEHLMTYLKMIPQIKNESVLYQPYVPEYVWQTVTSLIGEMQNEIEFWEATCKSLFDADDQGIDIVKAEDISNKVLLRIAAVEVAVKKRLTELAEP